MSTMDNERSTLMVTDVQNAEGNGAPNSSTLPITVKDLNFYYGDVLALKDINLEIPRNQVTAFIGPSGCGKSTLLRCFNRMNDLIDYTRVEGTILVEGEDIYRKNVDLEELRKRVEDLVARLATTRST